VSDAVIVARDLSRWYGEVIGLNEVSVEVMPGITGLLGPNGAGKSTFMRIVSGELRPSLGTARVLGERPFANARLHRRIGYCPEGDRFFDQMRVGDFLIHLLRLSGYSRRDAKDRAERSIEEVDLMRAWKMRMGALSKGMRQRVKLAQAIGHDPDLLLLDEPLGGLDPVARHATQDLIRRRAEAGASVLVSSHVLHEVEELTSRILLIHKGRIAATGEVREIRDLMDRHPHRIRIATTEPRRFAAQVVDLADLRGLSFEDGAVTVETLDPEGLYGALPALVVENDFTVTGIDSPDEKLEAVFDILVGGGS
jgi:ABC-2 type transport system ATP-binding protein